MHIESKGKSIRSIDDWKDNCPPKDPVKHWKKDRSAFELASSYIKNNDSLIKNIIISNGICNNVSIKVGYPEYETKLDNYGQGRVHDLLMMGNLDNDKGIISIEGKVDEPFGSSTIKDYYMKSKVKQINGSNTKVCNRIEEMLEKLFCNSIPDKAIMLQYQLLTAVIGTLQEANIKKAKKAIFLVQVFDTILADKKKLDKNHKDLEKLIEILSGSKYTSINNNQILGPFSGHNYRGIDLFIGYIKV